MTLQEIDLSERSGLTEGYMPGQGLASPLMQAPGWINPHLNRAMSKSAISATAKLRAPS